MEVESTSAAVPSGAASARRPIGEFLVERGLVTPEELAAALSDQRQSGKRLGEILVERGAITRMALASVLGEQWEEAGRASARGRPGPARRRQGSRSRDGRR